MHAPLFTAPPTVLSRLTSHPQPSPILNGSSVDLLCEAISGDLPISYSWTDPNAQALSPGDTDGRISFTLYIYGTYTCIATNHFGSDNSTVEVLIEAGSWNSKISHTIIIRYTSFAKTFFGQGKGYEAGFHGVQ